MEEQTQQPAAPAQKKIPYWRLARIISGFVFAPILVFGGLGFFLSRQLDNKAYVFILLAISFVITMALLLFNTNKIVKKLTE